MNERLVNAEHLKRIDRKLAEELKYLQVYSEDLDMSIEECKAREAIYISRVMTERLARANAALRLAKTRQARNPSTASGHPSDEDIFTSVDRELRGYEEQLKASDKKFDDACTCSRKKKRVVYDY